MKRARRHHSPEFKHEAVALDVEQGYSCAAAGRSLRVSGALIGRVEERVGCPSFGSLSRRWEAYVRAATDP